MEGKNAYSYTEDGTFMVISGEESFRRFFWWAHQSHSSRIHPQKLAARASYDGINFQTWIIPKRLIDSFPHFSGHSTQKKRGEKSSDPFLGCFFPVRIFATKAPYPKCPPSVKHWAGCLGFQCLPAILCSEDPVGQTPQAPKWKRPVMPAPPISIAEIRHAAKIHKVYGIYGWNIWAVKDLTAFALPFATLHLQWAALCSCKFASNCQSYQRVSGSISKNHLFVNHAGLTMELRKEYQKNYVEQD